MKKKILAALTAGILTTGLLTGNVFAADTEVKGDENLKGEVYAFIAASLYPVGFIEDKEASEDDTKAAEAFLDYVESDAAIKVFEDYGFTAYKAEDSKEDAEDSADSTEAEDSTDSTGSTSK